MRKLQKTAGKYVKNENEPPVNKPENPTTNPAPEPVPTPVKVVKKETDYTWVWILIGLLATIGTIYVMNMNSKDQKNENPIA